MASINSFPILSICIPTYNRGILLEQSIRKMIPLCQRNNIFICISDNASQDDTESIIQALADECKFLKYHRHPENIGPDNNFEYVLKMAETKYRWLMSDTCFVDELDSLMEDLLLCDWDGYVLNGDPGRAIFLPQQRVVYENSISVMEEIGWHLTWISCMIYNERLINCLNFERFKNSSFNQTALMFEPTANRDCKICFNPNIIVKNLPVEKESNWLYHVFDVMYRQWYLLIMSLPLYYPYETKRKCIIDAANKPTLLTIRFHAMRRIEGKWNWKDIIRNRFFIQQANGHCLCLLILGFCPGYIIKKFFLWGHYVKDFIRFWGVKLK